MNSRLDPLAAGTDIEGSYKRYLKTLLAPRVPQLAAEFDRVVDETTLLVKGPLLELTPPYAPSMSIRELIDDGVLHPGFGDLAGSLDLDRPLYQHQETAIRKAVAGRNLVVSTGTGSGKTESFLLPILHHLISERANGTLGPGVRALLLYPMNALANDQLKRLRELLAPMPDITFGRYTGETRESITDAEASFRALHPGARRLPNELLSRAEMRANPPHILLTNYAMLEYLLLRPADLDLFDGDYTGTWRFVALDEAHVYDGAQGSEVALLLRRLRQRVAPESRLQCIATSASLTGRLPESQGAEATTFAKKLLDVPFEYESGDPSRQDLVTATRLPIRFDASWSIDDNLLLSLADPDTDANGLARYSPTSDVADALHAESHIVELTSLLAGGPVDVRDLANALWPDDPLAPHKLEALVALGSRVKDRRENPVLSARYHLFVRATEGAFVSFADDGPQVHLSRHEIDPLTGRAVFEFGTCQRCGAVHLAGDVERVQRREYFRPARSDKSVHWLVLTDTATEELIDEDEITLGDNSGPASAAGVKFLCTGCGALGTTTGTCAGQQCPGGRVIGVREHKAATKIMSTCTECGARSRHVIRRLRTDQNAAPAVITTALYQHVPEATGDTADQVGAGRKLLMFSDSRQAAAFAAPYLQNTYGRILERRYLTQALQDPQYAGEELAVEDLAAIARDKAWQGGHFDESDTRVSVLKTVNPWVMAELMAVDQRISLEGLGLMRVTLFQSRKTELPRGFTSLGLTEPECWSLFDELLRTVRLQGALTLLRDVNITDAIFEPRNTTVRIRAMESNRAKRIISWLPSGKAGTTNNRLLFLRKVLATVGSTLDPLVVLDHCWEFLKSQDYLQLEVGGKGDSYQVNHEKLRIRSGIGHTWYQCSSCRRLSANSIRGVCPFGSCDGTLIEFMLPTVDADTHHYRALYRTLMPAPLSAREHTAQWAAHAAADIQRRFIAGEVNVLSCSTTFELGVDVGDLQSVMLRNMPPKTANYVQRAGRAGRRAASAALVVTYAKRSSHDLTKFQSPESMITGHMRIPWVPIDNERIGRRHAHSVALAAYFRQRFETDGVTWKQAAEFFTPAREGQDSPAAGVRSFLTPVPPAIRKALDRILTPDVAAAIGIDDDRWVTELDKLLSIAETDIRADINTFVALIEDAKATNQLGLGAHLQKTLKTIESRQLLGYLANKNILPKYGFPVDTVDLRTDHCDDRVGANLELSRDLGQAIFDYAPGNQVVAGGRVWTSRGLRKLPRKELEQFQYRVCNDCHRFECGRVLDVSTHCPSCEQPFGAIRACVRPEFGFVADRRVGDVKSEPPERLWNGDSYVEHIGEVLYPFRLQRDGGMAVQARAGTRAQMAVISNGHGGGFHVCDWCGWSTPVDKVRPGEHEHPLTGKSCAGRTRIVSLAHRYQTDVAEFTFADMTYTKEAEDQWLSALYAMLEGASEALEISRDDIDGTLSWSGDGRRSIVLFDTVPGGAGASKAIAENLETVIATAVERVSNCDCGPETSCYGCLRSFRNSMVHHQLSRAGALEIFQRLRLEVPTATTPSVLDVLDALLADLASRQAPEPEVGVEYGSQSWPLDAVWPDQRVVVVADDDPDRDTELAADSYHLVRLADTTSDDLAALLRSNRSRADRNGI